VDQNGYPPAVASLDGIVLFDHLTAPVNTNGIIQVIGIYRKSLMNFPAPGKCRSSLTSTLHKQHGKHYLMIGHNKRYSSVKSMLWIAPDVN
jgi:hypothetical protein